MSSNTKTTCDCQNIDHPKGCKWFKGQLHVEDSVHIMFCPICGQLWLAWPLMAWQKIALAIGRDPGLFNRRKPESVLSKIRKMWNFLSHGDVQ